MKIEKRIQTGVCFRELKIGDAIDPENRTVEVRFSSEAPVKRYVDGVLGDEILEHTPEAVNLGRLNDGGPVLMDHDARDHVGVVVQASIDPSDRVGRALLRFGKSQRAAEVFQDIVDGVRRTLSVGYVVRKYITEKVGREIVHRAVLWEPHEVTFTAVPADPSAQVGRSDDSETIETEVTTMDPKEKTEQPTTIDVEAVRKQARDDEIARIVEVTAIGERYKVPAELITKARDSGWSPDQMRKAVLDHIESSQERSGPATELGLSPKEVKNWSLMRALNAALDGNWRNAGFERECSEAIADELDRPARGFYIPWEIQTQRTAQIGHGQERVMVVGTDSAGGFLKPTEHLAGSFIELLRAKTLLGRLNARFLPGLRGDIEIPRLDTGVSFFWVGEDVDGTLSDAVLGQVALAPKTVTGQVPISRKLLKQSAPSIEQLLLGDLAAGAAQEIDLKGFEGSGAAGQPLGIMNQSGIGTVSIATWLTTGFPTHAEIVEFETDVAAANADLGTLAYVTTAPIRGAMKTTPIDAGSGIMLSTNNETNGYPLHVKTNLAAKTILFGNYEDCIVGMWGVLDVEPDKAAKAAAGGLVLRVFQDVDVAIRHAGSFSKAAA